jgi:phosphohistidine phosphatase
MDLILWRHAEAEDGNRGGDAARELTRRGRKQAQRMADWLRASVDERWRILASPARRTLQTVEALRLDFETDAAVGLDATPSGLLRAAGWPEASGSVLVVGHQPTLGQAAARLVGGAAGDISIRKGAIWWFGLRERDGRRETILRAVLDPDLLGD